MARPKIGIFGALVAVGGMLAWHWSQRHRASQARLIGDLNRWEDEGGALASTTQTAPAHPAARRPPGVLPDGADHSGGADRAGGTRDAWHFPHG